MVDTVLTERHVRDIPFEKSPVHDPVNFDFLLSSCQGKTGFHYLERRSCSDGKLLMLKLQLTLLTDP